MAGQNPLNIQWPAGPPDLRPGKAPKPYLTRAAKEAFMNQLFAARMAFVDALPTLTDLQKAEERLRQDTNRKSKIQKLYSRPPLTRAQERKRVEAQKVAEARERLNQPPEAGTRPPSPNPPTYSDPLQHPPLTPAEIEQGPIRAQRRDEIADELAQEPNFEAYPALGVVPGIPNSIDPLRSDLEVGRNTRDTFSIWTAIAVSMYDRHQDWFRIKADVIKYFFRVLNDLSHPRHRVYHILQSQSENYPDRPDLMDFILNTDSNEQPWSMHPGLWTVIADLYDVEVIVIRPRDRFPGANWAPVYEDPDGRQANYFAISRGALNAPGGQIILFFTPNPVDPARPNPTLDGSEQAWPVASPNDYVTHRRLGAASDLRNRVDDMPWAAKSHPDPARVGLRWKTPVGRQADNNFATPEEQNQLAIFERDLSYIRETSEARWRTRRRKEHIHTWSREIRINRNEAIFTIYQGPNPAPF